MEFCCFAFTGMIIDNRPDHPADFQFNHIVLAEVCSLIRRLVTALPKRDPSDISPSTVEAVDTVRLALLCHLMAGVRRAVEYGRRLHFLTTHDPLPHYSLISLLQEVYRIVFHLVPLAGMRRVMPAASSTLYAPLVEDILQSCGHFGRFAALIMSSRWSILRSCWTIIPAVVTALKTDTHTANAFGAADAALEIVRYAADQLDLATPQVLPDIIGCVYLLCSSIGTGSFSAISSEGDTYISKLEVDVTIFLERAWEALLGTDDLILPALEAFIATVSDPGLLRIMTADVMAVSVRRRYPGV